MILFRSPAGRACLEPVIICAGATAACAMLSELSLDRSRRPSIGTLGDRDRNAREHVTPGRRWSVTAPRRRSASGRGAGEDGLVADTVTVKGRNRVELERCVAMNAP